MLITLKGDAEHAENSDIRRLNVPRRPKHLDSQENVTIVGRLDTKKPTVGKRRERPKRPVDTTGACTTRMPTEKRRPNWQAIAALVTRKTVQMMKTSASSAVKLQDQTVLPILMNSTY